MSDLSNHAKVYLVTESTWDEHAVLSAWAKKADAEEEVRRLKVGPYRAYHYDVEEFEVYA